MALTGNSGHQVVDKIGLGTVEHLEVRIFLANLLGGVHGLGECLGHTMIGDGHCFLTPLMCPANQRRSRSHAVHIGHAGVQMELHPLFQSIIHHLHLVHSGDSPGTHDIFPGKIVIVEGTPHQDAGTGLELVQSLTGLGVFDVLDHGQGHGARIIGDVDGVDLPALIPGLPGLSGKDLTPHHHIAKLHRHIPQRYGLALGHGAQHRSSGLRDNAGQLVLLIPDTHLSAAGLLFHGFLVLLHLSDHGLPLPTDLLVPGFFHQSPAGRCHRALAHKLHLARDRKPAFNQLPQLHIGIAGRQQVIASMGQMDVEFPISKLCFRLVERPVDGGILCFQRSGQHG